MEFFQLMLLGIMIFVLSFLGGVLLRGKIVSDLNADHYGERLDIDLPLDDSVVSF